MLPGRDRVLPLVGIEWDMSRLDEGTLAELPPWIELHERVRPLIGPPAPRPPGPPAQPSVTGSWPRTALRHGTSSRPWRRRRPRPRPAPADGPRPDRRYHLTEEMPLGPVAADLTGTWSADGAELGGWCCATSGIALPSWTRRTGCCGWWPWAEPGAASDRAYPAGHGRTRLGREVRRHRPGLVAGAQPVRRGRARRPACGHRGGPRCRRRTQRHLARLARWSAVASTSRRSPWTRAPPG